LKRNHQKNKAQSVDESPATRPIPRGRLWAFRVVAMLLPVLLLGLLEIVLRLAGCGYDPGFLLQTRINGKEYFVNNDNFSLRFFPPTLARWPGTLLIPARKSPETTRIIVFGESAAMGDPQPAYGASRYLEVLLRERFPGKKFEVINVAFTAINSHVILPIARECAKLDGDVWIVYMGNNEMVGPFGAATVFGSQSPPLALVRLNLAIQKFRVGQLAMAALRKLAGKSANTAWGGMGMFLQNQIPPDDPRREAAYRNFEANLRDILHTGLDSGARVVLNTMSVNLKDCPPFASLANSNLPGAEREAFQKLYAGALQLEQQSQATKAVESFEQAARIDPTFAGLRFRWAECALVSSNPVARTNFQLACDVDALPFRADSRINAIIRRTGGQFGTPNLILADAEQTLAKACANGIAGDEVFFEHVHFNFRGNYLLGRLWAEQIKSLPGDRLDATPSREWASQEICDRDLGLTIWNRSFVLESVIRRMQQPPLSSQFNSLPRLKMFQTELDALRKQQAGTNALMRSGQALVDAIQRAPKDPFLEEGFANFLEAVGDRKQAAGAYEKLLALLPNDFYAKFQLGRLRAQLGQLAEGERLIQQAARQRSSIPDVWADLGGVQMAQKKYSQALDSYARAIVLRPQDAGYLCHQAAALAKLDRNEEAIASYRQAIQLQPGLAEAHYELAVLLVAGNQTDEALRAFAESIRLNPRHVASRIHLGNLLEQQGRSTEAIQQFQQVLQLDPKNPVARQYLERTGDRQNQTR